jgi:hypothetical protein
VIATNVNSGLCNVKTNVISSDWKSSSQMKVDIAFPTQMAEQWSAEGIFNAILMHASYTETHRATKHHGVEWDWSKMDLSSFRTSAQTKVMGLRPLATHTKFRDPMWCHILKMFLTTDSVCIFIVWVFSMTVIFQHVNT